MGLEGDEIFALTASLPPGWSLLASRPGAAGFSEEAAAAGGQVGEHSRLVVLADLIHAPDRGLRRRLTEVALAWPGTVELALVGAARALRRLDSPEALATRASDWAAAAQEAGLVDCWQLAPGPARQEGGRPTAGTDAPPPDTADRDAATPQAPGTPLPGQHP
jgi:hypothetical protein